MLQPYVADFYFAHYLAMRPNNGGAAKPLLFKETCEDMSEAVQIARRIKAAAGGNLGPMAQRLLGKKVPTPSACCSAGPTVAKLGGIVKNKTASCSG